MGGHKKIRFIALLILQMFYFATTEITVKYISAIQIFLVWFVQKNVFI